MTLIRALTLAALYLGACADALPAAERVSIQQLRQYAASLHAHLVIVDGIATNTLPLPPQWVCFEELCGMRYGLGTFLLRDEVTEEKVEVESFGSLSPSVVFPEPGDRVRLTAVVHIWTVPGEAGINVKLLTKDIVVLSTAGPAQSP